MDGSSLAKRDSLLGQAWSAPSRSISLMGGSPLAHLVVLRPLIEAGENGPGSGWHDGNFPIFAREGLDGLQRDEPHDGDELDLAAGSPRRSSIRSNPAIRRARIPGKIIDRISSS